MKLTSTIITVILALLGVAAMMYTVRRDGAGGASVTAGPRRLLSASDLPVDQIDRITLKRAGGEEMVFQRSGAEWNQTQPLTYPMDPFSMRQMAIAASELQVIDRLPRESLAADQTLATLQLTPPAAEITYQWPGGSLTLQLGRRTLGGRAYLRRAGDDAVYLVNQKLHERALDMNAAQWREKKIFLHAGIDSDRIAWVQSTVKLTLERDRKQWNMTEPEKTRVDRENLDAYLQALGRANVADFILDVKDQKELANFGLAEPVAALTVVTRVQASPASAPPASAGGSNSTSDPSTQASANVITERLLIGSQVGAATNDRFAMIEGRPVVVRLSEAVIGALFRMPENLAAPTGSGVNPADVKSIVIHTTDNGATAPAAPGAGSGAELRLERDLETWHAPQHNNAVVNAAAVQELLDQLCKLRAPKVEFQLYPSDLEIAKVSLYGFDGKALDTVRIAQQKDKPGTALENGDNVLRVFPQGLKLRLKASDYGL